MAASSHSVDFYHAADWHPLLSPATQLEEILELRKSVNQLSGASTVLATPNLCETARTLSQVVPIDDSDRKNTDINNTFEVTNKRNMETHATWNSASGHDSKHLMVMNWNAGDLDRAATLDTLNDMATGNQHITILQEAKGSRLDTWAQQRAIHVLASPDESSKILAAGSGIKALRPIYHNFPKDDYAVRRPWSEPTASLKQGNCILVFCSRCCMVSSDSQSHPHT